ncbi:MAG: RNA-metabolising metallo-beta-lactamase [Rhodospirillales bacterium]|nr:RNA-metabolising metallo-beta-lactamase [Rhodospirillales bacterium]
MDRSLTAPAPQMPLALTFHGAAGTVTGSKYLVESGRARLLVDCGLFQGFKQLRLRNWAPLPFDPRSLDAVILTHAHLDHSGALPLLARAGYQGPVYATPGTIDLCGLLLPDSGRLQEQDADFANRHGFSKHHPALPLYTEADAIAALALFRPVEFGARQEMPDGCRFKFHPAGHILGAAIVELETPQGRIVFSGDLGRPNAPTTPQPTLMREADWLLVESTYGDRRHEPVDPGQPLAEVVNRTAARGGTVLIPAFAVGRTQVLIYHLHRLKRERAIPDLPVFLDSPMAVDASEIFCKYHDGLSAAEWRAACHSVAYVRSVEESKALSANPMPKIILSASGMATGGRVLHHLKQYAPDPRHTILFAGYQAGGTRGAALTQGAKSVKIHGTYVPVRAEVDNLSMLSAHADSDEIMGWLKGFARPPRAAFITHGEPAAADALRHRIEEELGWVARVPEHGERVSLA